MRVYLDQFEEIDKTTGDVYIVGYKDIAGVKTEIRTKKIASTSVDGLGTASTHAHEDYEPAKGADDNFVTDAEKTAIGTIGDKAPQSTTYTKTEVDNKVSSLYKFKGSVANYAALPSTAQVIGDVWNLTDTGMNYAWTSVGWDALGSIIALATAVENGLLSASDFTKLANLPTELANRPAAVAGIYPVTALPEQEALYAYGVQYDLASSSPVLLRVGNRSFHASLPIQSKMRGCLLLDNGTVNYYLYPTNWAFKEDGITASNLTGTDGQVMIEIPKHYRKFDYPTPTTYRCMISEYPLTGYTEVKKQYTSAYEATIQRSNLKLASVVNLTADYRGGNNNAARDLLSNTDLGKPATNKTIIEFRTYARNRNAGATAEWNQLSYENYKSVVWLYYIEYANLNVQLPVAARDANGYAAGGLGNGITTADSAKWNTFNGYYPFINCGASNSLGNGSGEVSVSVTDFQGVGVPQSFAVPRYRGIEHLFGHLWKFTDGIVVDVKTDAEGGTSTVYTTLLPANFANTITANYVSKGLESRLEGWIKTMLLGTTGELMATTLGGGSTTYWCDYKYCNVASSSLRCVLFGGTAHSAPAAGLGFSHTIYAFSAADTTVGSRLCFIPA